MKTMFLSATALALILSLPAAAAEDDHHGHQGGGHAGGGHTTVTPPPGGGAAHAAPDTALRDHPGHGDVDHGHGGGGTGGTAHDTHTDNTTNIIINNGGATHDSHTHAGRGHNSAFDTPRAGGNTGSIIFGIGGHGYRNTTSFGHSRHNSAFDRFRKAVHASHRYHDGTYNQPSGWYAHTWNYGDFLPALFFADRYQIDDYADFDLSDPPDGTVWVRYGNDALLVDDETGEIIQVVYGIFY